MLRQLHHQTSKLFPYTTLFRPGRVAGDLPRDRADGRSPHIGADPSSARRQQPVTTILVSRRGSDGDGHAADREIERCGNRGALAGAESSKGSPGPVERRVRPGEEDESFAGIGRASVGYAQDRKSVV